jgi:hypothetical protein
VAGSASYVLTRSSDKIAHQHISASAPRLCNAYSFAAYFHSSIDVVASTLFFWRSSALATPAGTTRDVVMLRKERVRGPSVLQTQTQSAVRRSKLMQTPAVKSSFQHPQHGSKLETQSLVVNTASSSDSEDTTVLGVLELIKQVLKHLVGDFIWLLFSKCVNNTLP